MDHTDADGRKNELQSGADPASYKGSLKPGKDADVVVIDPKESYVIDVKDFASKGKNTPFQGKKVNGKVKVTICGGRVVYEDK